MSYSDINKFLSIPLVFTAYLNIYFQDPISQPTNDITHLKRVSKIIKKDPRVPKYLPDFFEITLYMQEIFQLNFTLKETSHVLKFHNFLINEISVLMR